MSQKFPAGEFSEVKPSSRVGEHAMDYDPAGCPTCKSRDKNVRLRYEGAYPQYRYHDCRDSWHEAVEKAEKP